MNLYAAIAKATSGASRSCYWDQLRMILVVLVPTLVYVALIDNPW